MSRLVAVPDWGDSGSLYQWIKIPEPGDDGYPMAELPEGDPWASAVNGRLPGSKPKLDHQTCRW
jgi:hypothetical protein